MAPLTYCPENGERSRLLTTRRVIVLCALLLAVAAGYFSWRRDELKTLPPQVDKQPIVFASRTFDPAAPPSDMPPLNPGESAECDSDFVSYASVAGQPRPIDATHESVTITKVNVTLELHVTIWVPTDASQHVIEHESGHRQISEHYYEFADKVAEQIAASYTGKQVVISGTDLNAELSKLLQQMSADITAEYDKELDPEPAQLRYDAITDHSRNEIASGDAVAQALKETAPVSTDAQP
jgi:hypothetical protein